MKIGGLLESDSMCLRSAFLDGEVIGALLYSWRALSTGIQEIESVDGTSKDLIMSDVLVS